MLFKLISYFFSRTSLIGYTLDLITAFVSLNESIVSFKEIFHLTNLLLGYLDKDSYPKEINVGKFSYSNCFFAVFIQ